MSSHQEQHLRSDDQQHPGRTQVRKRVCYIDIPLVVPPQNPEDPIVEWPLNDIRAIAAATVTSRSWTYSEEELREAARALAELADQPTIAALRKLPHKGSFLRPPGLLSVTSSGERSLLVGLCVDSVQGQQRLVPYASFRLGDGGSKQLAGGILGKLPGDMSIYIRWAAQNAFEQIRVADAIVRNEDTQEG